MTIDRRTVVKGFAAFIPTAYIWIPRVAIAKFSGDARDAVIRSHQVIVSNWGDEITNVASANYSDSIPRVHKTLSSESYSKHSVTATEFQHSKANGTAWVSAFTEDERDYCHHYFPRSSASEMCYISTLPFIIHSYAIEDAVKHLSSSGSIDAIYPVETVRSFYKLDADVPSTVRVIAKNNVWTCTQTRHSYRAGTGTMTITRRSTSQVVFRQVYEFDYA